MTSVQPHDPKYLDQDLRERIAHAVQDIAQGAEAEATIQQLVLGLQHDHSLFREALVEILQDHPHCLMFGFDVKNLAVEHQLQPEFTEALDELIQKHEPCGVVIMFGGQEDNAAFEPDDRFQRMRVCSPHQSYPQDPLTDVCRLYHEHGHFLSRKEGFWSAEFQEANRVFRAQSTPSDSEASEHAALSHEQKWLVLEEEIRAWLLGRPPLLMRRSTVRSDYDRIAVRSISTYSEPMEIAQADWEQRDIQLNSRRRSSTWAKRG